MKSHLLACAAVNRLPTTLCFPTTLQFKCRSHTECECSRANPIRFLFPLLIDKTVKTLCWTILLWENSSLSERSETASLNGKKHGAIRQENVTEIVRYTDLERLHDFLSKGSIYTSYTVLQAQESYLKREQGTTVRGYLLRQTQSKLILEETERQWIYQQEKEFLHSVRDK